MEQQPIQQRSDMWHRLRLGKFTSGHAHVFMAKSKVEGEPNAGAKTFIDQKLWELVCGHHKEIKAWQLEHGNLWEPFAKKQVQEKYQSEYFDEGFLQNPTLPYHGGSPDGYIVINGMEVTPEIKCPVGEQHLVNTRLFRTVEALKKGYPELYWQCQSNMHLQNTKVALAVTFNAEAGKLAYKDIMIPRNDEDIALMLERMAQGWDYMLSEAKELGIDVLAAYEEYSKPAFVRPEAETEFSNAA